MSFDTWLFSNIDHGYFTVHNLVSTHTNTRAALSVSAAAAGELVWAFGFRLEAVGSIITGALPTIQTYDTRADEPEREWETLKALCPRKESRPSDHQLVWIHSPVARSLTAEWGKKRLREGSARREILLLAVFCMWDWIKYHAYEGPALCAFQWTI